MEAKKAMDDIKLALLGDKEAAKRLTEAGAVMPTMAEYILSLSYG